MAVKKVRVGVAGVRWVGDQHASALSRIRGVELAALADINPDSLDGAKKKYGVDRGFADYNEMIKSGGLNAIAIALPTGMHADACCRAMRAGLHVICEKPPTSNVAEMERVARVAKETGMTYMFARQSRFNPAVLASRKAVKAGKLGRIYHGEAVWVRSRWGVLANPGWRMDRNGGGGVMLDLGVHVIDEVWFCMGCPRPVEVSAGLYAGFKHFSKKPKQYTADDCAAGLVRFENSVTLRFLATFALNGMPPGSKELPDKGTPNWGRRVIYGTKAGLDTSSGTLITGGCNDLSAKGLPLTSKYSGFEGQAREFIRAVRSGSVPMSSAEQAVMLMQILEAARRSADKGRAVRIRK